MLHRRKALIILGFETPDRKLHPVERGWNQLAINNPSMTKIRSTTSTEFMIVRDKETRRPGFIEFELQAGEDPMQALRRVNPLGASAAVKPWKLIEKFPYTENNNIWEILTGCIGVGADQRGVDFDGDSDEFPFLGWFTPSWLYRQQEDGLLSLTTSAALAKSSVRQFILSSWKKEAA